MIILSAYSRVLTYLKKIVYELLFIEQWQLRYKFSKNTETGLDDQFDTYQKIVPPKDRFWADPFMVEENGVYYVFIEELKYKEGKGYIAVIELKEDVDEPLKSQKILEKPYHLSYPFIFKLKDTYYMIPEGTANKTIELYRCEEFPLKWNYCNTLMENVIAADSTITFYQGKYWMFTMIEPEQGVTTNKDLHIFYSEDLLSNNWVAHPANPVVSNVGSARPAGNIFEDEGVLYRPSQDCSERYGWAMRLNKIITLNENEYLEEEVVHIKPNWERNLLATHTFNKVGKLSMIDVLVKRSRFLSIFWIFLGAVNKFDIAFLPM